MGNSLSCFDSMREKPPYSWPKDHPERAEAIAEHQRSAIAERQRTRRKQTIAVAQAPTGAEPAKPVPAPATTTTADAAAAPTPAPPAPPAEQPGHVEPPPADEVAKDAALQLPTDPVLDEVTAATAAAAAEKTPDDPNAPVDAASRDAPAVDVVPTPDAPAAVADDKPDVEAEDPRFADQPADGEPKHDLEGANSAMAAAVPEDDDQEAVNADPADGEKDPNAVPAAHTDKDEEKEETHHTGADDDKDHEDVAVDGDDDGATPAATATTIPKATSAIDTRRATFEQMKDDELPKPKELTRDVLDPVTNEHITLTEYRRRQTERAEGVVKERIEKIEKVNDEMAEERAVIAAIEEVRTDVIHKSEWKFKGSPVKSSMPAADVTPITMTSTTSTTDSTLAADAVKDDGVAVVGDDALPVNGGEPVVKVDGVVDAGETVPAELGLEVTEATVVEEVEVVEVVGEEDVEELVAA